MAASASSRRVRRAVRWRARAWTRRYLMGSDAFALAALSLCAAGLGALFLVNRTWFPLSTLAVVVLAGGFLLSVRSLVLLDLVVAAVVLLELANGSGPRVSPGAVLVVAATAAIVHLLARSRGRLGVQGTRGDSMLVDLRDRLTAQGEMPDLPEGWSAEVVLRSAGGASFSGDFLVATRSDDGSHLEVALVDVSGKGVDAGTRALLLSGALGGLLGAKEPSDFLPAANAYLLRQDWDEGFATAVHLVLDLRTGDYAVHSAGHPPVALFDAGSGRWSLVEAGGVVLGLLPDVSYAGGHGRLDRGDALILYTDGLVEIPGRDLSVGIDKLLGEAERLVPRGFHGGADTLVTKVAGTSPDDRGLVLIWRAH